MSNVHTDPGAAQWTIAAGKVGPDRTGQSPVPQVRVWGFSLYSAAGCVINLRAGSSTGRIIDPISIAAGESARETWPRPKRYEGGVVFVEVVSGVIPVGTIEIA